MSNTDMTIAAALLRRADDLRDVQRIVRTAARVLAGADGATFVLRDVDSCFYADEDALSPLWKGQRFPITSCISGWAMLHDEAVVVPDITADDRIPQEAYRPTFVRSLAMIPVGTEKPAAAIGAYWARRHAATKAETAALGQLAAATAEALDRIGLAGVPAPPALAADPGDGEPDLAPGDRAPTSPAGREDRERIGRDLHDTVLQNLYAARMRLQRVRAQAAGPSPRPPARLSRPTWTR